MLLVQGRHDHDTYTLTSIAHIHKQKHSVAGDEARDGVDQLLGPLPCGGVHVQFSRITATTLYTDKVETQYNIH